MRILIACECSGIVREAFRKKGHDAWSCDTQPADDKKGHHFHCDVLSIINNGWDMLIAHPPCTDICVSGAKHFKEKVLDGRQKAGIDFFMKMVNARINKIAVENPIGIMSTLYRKPDQIIDPSEFGHGDTKATCLWLKNLPCLIPPSAKEYTKYGIYARPKVTIHNMPPSADRGKLRSITYQGIANAMADQWG